MASGVMLDVCKQCDSGIHPLTPDTYGLVSPGAAFPQVCLKLINTGWVFVVDFDNNCKLIGCIGKNDFNKAVKESSSPETLTANDIVNKNCKTATLETLDNDISLLKKYAYLPVVDSDGSYQFYISNQSNWLCWSDEDQEFELCHWSDELKKGTFSNENIKTRTFDSFYPADNKARELLRDRLNGIVLEVGAGPFLGVIWSIHQASRRIIIEPLADKYAKLRKKYHINVPDAECIEVYSQGADVFTPELEHSADVILCHNALDHTPNWSFVLGNLTRYMKKGGLIYLGTDIDHHTSNIPGHYNITYNPDKLYNLLTAFGFDILYRHCTTRIFGNTFITIVGKKKQ